MLRRWKSLRHYVSSQPLKQTSPSQLSTPLSAILKQIIRSTGPLTTARFMRECLSHPVYGYYQRTANVFGSKGDFITSPDISQLFGEMLGIWLMAQWRQMGAPDRVHLCELGPGRGTLLADILRVAKRFPDFWQALHAVHCIESSLALQRVQRRFFLGKDIDTPLTDNVEEFHLGKRFAWHAALDPFPAGSFPMIVAHEFLDAMPVHQFQMTRNGWREVLIDEQDDQFKWVLCKEPTLFSTAYAAMPRMSKNPEVGETVEFSPDVGVITEKVARLISETNGTALFIDYGNQKPHGHSLRAVRQHAFESILTAPGEADLSADVDFDLVHRMASRFASCTHAVPQGDFLHQLGIRERLSILGRNATPEQQRDLVAGYKRIVSDQEMGRVYKIMAILPKNIQPVIGFH